MITLVGDTLCRHHVLTKIIKSCNFLHILKVKANIIFLCQVIIGSGEQSNENVIKNLATESRLFETVGEMDMIL